MRVAAIIPALNEESSLPLVLSEIDREQVGRVVVVDNGSTDDTATIAVGWGAEAVSEPRRGYGRACLSGIAALAGDPPEIVLFIDADYSDHPEQAARLIGPIESGGCDLVIGSRMLGERERGALLPQAYFGNKLACGLMKRTVGFQYTDLGPFRAIRYQSLLALGMRDENFGWTVEMQMRAVQKGLRILEVPVSYRRRVGTSKITGTLSGTLKAGTKILYSIYKYK